MNYIMELKNEEYKMKTRTMELKTLEVLIVRQL